MCYNIINSGYAGKGSSAVYQIGDVVVYGTQGICSVVALEEREIDRKRKEYFVLEPKDQPGARFYVPTGNQAALAKLHRLLSKDELEAILRAEQTKEDAWIQDEGRRKLYYRELIGSGDRAALLRMVNTLYRHKREQAAAGRKFHLCDENFLRDAEKLLSAEFSEVLGIPREKIGEYVTAAME